MPSCPVTPDTWKKLHALTTESTVICHYPRSTAEHIKLKKSKCQTSRFQRYVVPKRCTFHTFHNTKSVLVSKISRRLFPQLAAIHPRPIHPILVQFGAPSSMNSWPPWPVTHFWVSCAVFSWASASGCFSAALSSADHPWNPAALDFFSG